MRNGIRSAGGILAAATLFLSGCPSGTTPTGLTAEQQAAVEDVVRQLESAIESLGGLGGLANPEFSIDGTDRMFGTCPQVTISIANASANISINFGNGCSNELTGDRTVSGRLLLDVLIAARSGSLTFDDFTVDGRSVAGTATMTITGEVGSGLSFSGTMDISTGGGGMAVGAIALTFRPGGDIELAPTTLALSDGTDAYNVTINGIVVNPTSNGNFVPQAGTAMFASGTTTLTVRFDGQSPVDGTVDVTVGINGPTFTYDIPGVG